jgi:hypothetical protein
MRANTPTRSLITGAALVLGTAATAAAQGQQLFRWSGSVDQEIQLTMSGRDLSVSGIGRRESGQGQSNITSSLPRESGFVSVQLAAGRGSVDVIRQPTAANGYTTVVRIRDPQGGAADYTINAFWQGSATGEVGPPYGRGRGYGRNRDMANNGVTSPVALQWSGDVDDNIVIHLVSGGVTYRTVSGKDPRGVQSSFAGIPQGAAHLTVNQTEGRGSVTVIQQPTAQNGYAATLRVVDPQRGYGHYAFNLTWR